MEIDERKFDTAALALLLLGLYDGTRVWKGFDWATLDGLHAAELISQPAGKAKSVVLTEQAMAPAQAEFEKLFSKTPHERSTPAMSGTT